MAGISGKIDYVSIPIDGVIWATQQAVQVQLYQGGTQWIPRRCLPKHIDDEIMPNEYNPLDEIKVARWFAEKEGIL